ncbi:MAG TPA: TIGR04076 family protein [Candidatus Saccharimonadales bacterium]|nr:TIGR04076 family protein [Candidatus Saccharimonadales bacterium]
MKYDLYDLEITVVGDSETFNCSHKVGDTLVIRGENLSFKVGTEQFSHYALATLTPYIAAKQRVNQKSDWMYYETEIACPDPKCGARFRFERVGKKEHVYTPNKV